MDHPFVTGLTRVTLLNVPLDVIPEDRVAEVAQRLADTEGHKTVVFLTYAQFMKARRDPDFLAMLRRATLVVPVSRAFEFACRFLRLPEIVRHYPFDFCIRLLGALEEKRRTIYLLGDHHEGVQTIAANIRTSFPGLVLVGRHTGFYARSLEEPILQAIHKATPTVLLVGPGIPGREKWAFRQGAPLPVRLSLYSEETFQIMSGRKRRPSKAAFRKGTYGVVRSLVNPLRIARVFSYLWFGLHLLAARVTTRR